MILRFAFRAPHICVESEFNGHTARLMTDRLVTTIQVHHINGATRTYPMYVQVRYNTQIHDPFSVNNGTMA
jgi:hypothetical protein